MRLLMAVSTDGYLCRGPDDDMDWTGPADKALFRVLTSVGGVCAAGTTTWNLMPALEARQLIPLSREGYTLRRLEDEHPEAWLLGGPTVANAALCRSLVREVHLSVVHGVWLHEGVICDVLGTFPPPAMETDLGDVTHRVHRL